MAASFDPAKVGFQVRIGDEISSYRVLGISVLPGQRLEIELLAPGQNGRFIFSSTVAAPESVGLGKWIWTAPRDPGSYPLEIRSIATNETMILNAFVLFPINRVRNGRLNGYQIGSYPAPSKKRADLYSPPPGLIEVTEENRATLVSPHFRLEQFLCKQESGYPKYLVLRTRLLLKLEAILEIANRAGYRCDTFHIMSGYRTPQYNREIGNVRYSRHLWGGAADIFIDADPIDGMMDDLNHDGRIDYRDAEILYDLIESAADKPWYEPLVGGLAPYKRTDEHGPFVHVDVRGFHARWGR